MYGVCQFPPSPPPQSTDAGGHWLTLGPPRGKWHSLAWWGGLQSSGWTLPHNPEAPAADHQCLSKPATDFRWPQGGNLVAPSPALVGASLVSCWRMRSCPAFTHNPSSFSCIHAFWAHLAIFPHEFLWSLLREGGNLKVERRVGVELIRMEIQTVKAQTFQRSCFYFPMANCPFWKVPEMMCHGIPPNKSLVRMILGSVLLVCWSIFHSVSFLLLKKKKSAINKMYFCNFHVYIWYISTNGQLL